MTLSELPTASGAVVGGLDLTGPERRPLMNLGVLLGVGIGAEGTSTLGDPTAYLLRGCPIALRRWQARGIRREAMEMPQ